MNKELKEAQRNFWPLSQGCLDHLKRGVVLIQEEFLLDLLLDSKADVQVFMVTVTDARTPRSPLLMQPRS